MSDDDDWGGYDEQTGRGHLEFLMNHIFEEYLKPSVLETGRPDLKLGLVYVGKPTPTEYSIVIPQTIDTDTDMSTLSGPERASIGFASIEAGMEAVFAESGTPLAVIVVSNSLIIDNPLLAALSFRHSEEVGGQTMDGVAYTNAGLHNSVMLFGMYRDQGEVKTLVKHFPWHENLKQFSDPIYHDYGTECHAIPRDARFFHSIIKPYFNKES